MIANLTKMIFEAIVFLTITSVAYSGYTFPDDFKSCSANADPSCLVDLVQDAFTKFGTKGVSSPIAFNTNPMIMPFWNLKVNYDVVTSHEYFWNLSHPTLWNSTVLAASFDTSKYFLNITTYNEDLAQYNSHYYLWAQFHNEGDCYPELLYGNGTVDKHIYGVTMQHNIAFFPTFIDGVEYFYLKSFDVVIKDYKNVVYNYHNLYNGNKVLAKRASDFINTYATKLVRQKPEVFSDLLVTMFEYYTQLLISSVPARKIREHLAG